ncbi:hypothetical protein GCM10019017_55600 [Streptomyces showdoensis]
MWRQRLTPIGDIPQVDRTGPALRRPRGRGRAASRLPTGGQAHALRGLIAVGAPASPFDPLRIVEELLSVRQAGSPQEFEDVAIAVCEAEDFVADGDAPAAGGAGAVDDYRGTHASRVRRG